jgi:hypothetical protein
MRLLKLLRESAAADDAHKQGLTSAGGAYWMDKTGKITHKTVQDKLVKVPEKPAAGTASATATPQSTPATPKPAASATPAPIPSAAPTPTPSAAATPTPSAAPKPTPSASPTPTPVTTGATPVATPQKKAPLTADVILGKKVGNAGGSNKGGFYEGTDGVTRYVKEYQDPTRSHAEKLANEIYSALGLTAPNAHTFPVGGKTIYASDIIDGQELGKVGVTPENANKILDGFAADVLVGNWDTVGLVNDNVLITPDGQPARIDNGGTFLFRAQEASGRKPDALLDKISEWDAFSNPAVNASYSNIFKTAGVKNANALGDRVVDQINKIKQLEQSSGGWDKIVNASSPDMKPEDKQQVIQMLNSRSKLLYQKAQELQGQANG